MWKATILLNPDEQIPLKKGSETGSKARTTTDGAIKVKSSVICCNI